MAAATEMAASSLRPCAFPDRAEPWSFLRRTTSPVPVLRPSDVGHQDPPACPPAGALETLPLKGPLEPLLQGSAPAASADRRRRRGPSGPRGRSTLGTISGRPPSRLPRLDEPACDSSPYSIPERSPACALGAQRQLTARQPHSPPLPRTARSTLRLGSSANSPKPPSWPFQQPHSNHNVHWRFQVLTQRLDRHFLRTHCHFRLPQPAMPDTHHSPMDDGSPQLEEVVVTAPTSEYRSHASRVLRRPTT